ncbi:MAG: hypothetical protein U0573_01390 [Phycisphaerales bacterium]|nr:hypothetical protein [Planctomycetota bacterium]
MSRRVLPTGRRSARTKRSGQTMAPCSPRIVDDDADFSIFAVAYDQLLCP